MKLFDKLRRSTDDGSDSGSPGDSATAGDGENSSAAEVGQPMTTAPSEAPAALGSAIVAPDPGRYDPTHPCHAPVCGVDLVLFAQLTQRLRIAPAKERDALLAGHGHTPESWSAVNTVWMARFGQMPYLCVTFDEAPRLS